MAAHTKLYGKDLKAYQDVDLDALLAKLTDEELEELHTELIDPDVRVNLVISLSSREFCGTHQVLMKLSDILSYT